MQNQLNVDPTKYTWEFLGSTLIPYSKLDGNVEKVDPELVKSLLKIQHVDPKAKKKLFSILKDSGVNFGSDKYSSLASKLGFKTPSEFNYYLNHGIAENT